MEIPKIPVPTLAPKRTQRSTAASPIHTDSTRVEDSKQPPNYVYDRRKNTDRRKSDKGTILDSRGGSDRRKSGQNKSVNIEV